MSLLVVSSEEMKVVDDHVMVLSQFNNMNQWREIFFRAIWLWGKVMIVFIYSVFRAAFISLHHLRLLCLWKIDSFTLFLALEKDCCCCSVTQSRPTLCKPMDYSMPDLPHHLLEFAQVNIQHRLCRPAISSSDVLFVFCPQSFPTSGTFWMIGMFTSDDQNTVVSVSVLPVNIQDWSPLRLTGLISLLSKEL